MVEYRGKGHLNDKQREFKAKLQSWYKCPVCKGIGPTENKPCRGGCYKWTDTRIHKNSSESREIWLGEFMYNLVNIMKESSNTTHKHIIYIVQFAWWLKDHGFRVNNVQDLGNFYKRKGKSSKESIEFLENLIKKYIMELGERGGESFQKNHLGAISTAYRRNRVILQTTSLYETAIVEDEDMDERWGYVMSQIQLLHERAKEPPFKTIINILTSAAPRGGGFLDSAIMRKSKDNDFLKIKDLQEATDGLDRVPFEGGTDTVYEYLQRTHPEITENPTYLITFYGRSKKYHYQTPCSPEAYRSINTMLEERKNAGEDVIGNDRDALNKETYESWNRRLGRLRSESLKSWMQRNGESPVFRNGFRIEPYYYYVRKKKNAYGPTTISPTKMPRELERIYNITNPRPLSIKSIRKYFRMLRNRIGDKVKFSVEGHHPIDSIHGFRHFHKVALRSAGVDPDLTEWFQGRKIDKSAEAYSRGFPTYRRLIEYFNAINSITIDKTQILARENAQLKASRDDLQTELRIHRADFAHIFDRLEALETGNKALYALAAKKASPSELEEATRMLRGSSLQLPDQKGKVIELRNETEVHEEGKSDIQ